MFIEERGAALPPPSLQNPLPSPRENLVVGIPSKRGGVGGGDERKVTRSGGAAQCNSPRETAVLAGRLRPPED